MNIASRNWIIGVDFDNTIAGYDELMYEIASERGLIAGGVAKNKRLIRDALRALPDGESHWRSLQVTAYGPRMHEARLIEGVREFFTACRSRRIPVRVVSHKTEYANFGEPGVNLRTVAMAWLEHQGFFDNAGPGLRPADVFFESTRTEKIERIKALGATHFIDDLEETFLECGFPQGVMKILLTARGAPLAAVGAAEFASWTQIHAHLLGDALVAG